MTQYQSGLDALTALHATNEDSGSKSEFATFKSGTSYIVKVVDKSAVQLAYGYGSFNDNINSFVAKNPSKRNAKGYVDGDETPWDKASAYHKAKSAVYTDENGQLAYKYAGKPRFAMAFFDVNTGEYIIVDLTKNQALAVSAVIAKNEKKLDKKPFELEKTGTGTSTAVTLSPLDLDDLTDAQQAKFADAPKEFDPSVFTGIWYEKDDEEQIADLRKSGFDVSLLGYDATTTSDSPPSTTDIDEDSLPF